MEPPKGFKDFTGQEAEKRAVITEILTNIFQRYGFQPAETPVIEYENFVKSDNSEDEAVSDIYKLKDKGKRKLALRYEFTFQSKRLMQNKKLPYKKYQIGPVFRDEPIKGNRLRQFTTCEADIIGATLKDQAELLAIIREFLDTLKIQSTIYINNRKLMNEILEEFKIKNKEAVIREIDKLDKLTEKEVKQNLKKYNASNILEIFKKPETYFEKYPAYSEIKEIKQYCSYYNINLTFQPSLARGLSYYNGTVFEIKNKEIKETICGGGAYKFNNIQSIGFGVSIDRLSVVTKMLIKLEKYLIVSLEQDKKAISLAKQLRKKGKNVSIYYGKPSKALEYANSYQINKVIFVGAKEVKTKKFRIKDMKLGKETLLKN